MSGGKETPRQKMIGMMYLVLTAMLALNVSVEVLKSFLMVNDAMVETNANFKIKVESLYNEFFKAYQANPPKTEEYWQKAQIAQKKSKELYEYLELTKKELVAYVEGITLAEAEVLPTSKIGKQDNYDMPTQFFIGQTNDGQGGRAQELRIKIEAYRATMLDLLDPKDRDKVKLGLQTAGPYYNAAKQEQSWEMQFFYKTIVVADLTILNKLQTDVLNAEFDIVSQLLSSVSDDDFKFDNIAARVVPASNFVLLGNSYEAEIFVAAFDSKSEITGTIGGQKYVGDSGSLKFTRMATSVGPQSVDGTINVQSAFGIKSYPFKLNYIVAAPMATVSADAMNVMYIGVDNPISVLAGGATEDNTKVTITNGTLTKDPSKGPGRYNARVNSPGKAVISVYITNKGLDKLMGSYEFRVKKVPDPVARVNGQAVGTSKIEKNTLVNAAGLVVSMPDFEFQMNISVSSFTMQIARNNELTAVYTSNSNRFTDDMINQINRCRRGDKIYIENIMARMPEGNRPLNSPINLTIL